MEQTVSTEETLSPSSTPTSPYLIEDATELYSFRRDRYVKPTASFPVSFLSALPFTSYYGGDTARPERKPLALEELKLPKFDHAEEAVQYRDFVGKGNEGLVVSVAIKGKIYALKIFNTYVWAIGDRAEDTTLITESLPFADECRAFAHIHNKNLDGVYTCKCYGWMKVDPSEVCKTLQIAADGLGSYAVVKEYIPEKAGKEHMEGIIQSIRGLDEIGIIPFDCSPHNFRGSRLVDLGHARFEPHDFSPFLRTREQYVSYNVAVARGCRWDWLRLQK